MSGFSVKIDKEDLADVEAAMIGIKNGYAKIVVRSLNKTITGVRTDAVKEVQKEITPKAKVIRDTFILNKANYANLSASVESTGWPLPLIHYLARAVKMGVSFQVFKRDGRSTLRGGFIATMKSGHKGVFWRKYKDTPGYKAKTSVKRKLPEKYRLPIRQRYGPAVPSVLEQNKVMDPILVKAGDRLAKELDHQLEFEMSKL